MVDDLVAHDQPARDEETCASHAIQKQECASAKQDGKRKQAQHCGNEPTPASKGEPHEFHAACPQFQGSGDEVQGAQKRPDAEQGNGDHP